MKGEGVLTEKQQEMRNRAVERCDPSHPHPGPGYDYPCWNCILDAYFEVREEMEVEIDG